MSPSKPFRGHLLLDSILVATLFAIAAYCQRLQPLLASLKAALETFPDHYASVFDFVKEPMDPVLAGCLFVVDVYFLVKTYWLEADVVQSAHKKYHAHGNAWVAKTHGIGSSIEFLVGWLAVSSFSFEAASAGTSYNGISTVLAKATALLALLVNIPTGFVMSPKVFGVKCLTVPGFVKFGFLRSLEALRVLLVDARLVPNLWILLHVGTLVRLLGYFVLPYTSRDGKRGDLFTEPLMYSFNILLSGYITAAFVYPPKYLLGSLIVYVAGQWIYPPKVASARAAMQGRQADESSSGLVAQESSILTLRKEWREGVKRKE